MTVCYRLCGVVDLIDKRASRAFVDVYGCHTGGGDFTLIKTKMKRFHVDIKIGFFISFKDTAAAIEATSDDCRRARGVIDRHKRRKFFGLTTRFTLFRLS